MVPFHRLYFRARNYGINHKTLYLLSLMVFFWAIFDGILSYVFPLAIIENGFSKTMLGVIIGSSSVVGAVFDFVLSKYLKDTHFRRMYLLMFAVCFLVPIILFAAKPLWLFLMSAALWGMYYDLHNFGNFDFIGRTLESKDHAGSFGTLSIFGSLGRMIAPILAGLTIGALIDWKPYLLMYVMLIIAFVFFCILFFLTKKEGKKSQDFQVHKRRNFLKEINLWEKIGKIIFPVLMLTMLLNIFDAFFWTIGPLLSESYRSLSPFNGLFLTFYMLPPLIVGWFVGNITLKFGKKRAAFLSFIVGSLLLSIFPFVTNSLIILGIIFASACFIAIAWPSINGAYADYISEALSYESEIKALEDFFANLGYIIGPIMAGVLADNFGNENAFLFLGVTGAIIAFILWRKTPKQINVRL